MSESYEVKVFLYGIEPEIWREFTIPSSATFEKLHEVIQAAMGWERRHLHEFRHGKGRNLTSVVATPDEEIVKGDDFRDERETTLKELLGRKRFPFRMLYRYDFTDEWVHEVKFAGKVEGSSGKAEFKAGERNCPPEDCGGAHGYRAAVDGDLDWMDDEYDPEAFDAEAAAERVSAVRV